MTVFKVMLDVRRQGLILLKLGGWLTASFCILLLISGGPPAPPSPPPTVSLKSTPVTISDDYHQLMNLSNFWFQQRASCPNNGSTPLVVVVHSAPDNVEFRDAIRDSWGGVEGARVIFMIGMTSDQLLQRELNAEGLLRGDLVQGSFNDSYRNLTYKHVMALKWVKYHCHEARYILKTDDDVFVYLPGLLELISNSTFPNKNLILCDVAKKAEVKRSWRSKWRVSPKEYLDRHYPTYCSGWIVLYSQDVAHKLYEATQREDFFWIDDVLVTGVAARKVRARHHTIRPWQWKMEAAEQMLKNATKPSVEQRGRLVFGPFELEAEEILALWALRSNNKHLTPSTLGIGVNGTN